MTVSKARRAPVLVVVVLGLAASGCSESAGGLTPAVPVVPVARAEPADTTDSATPAQVDERPVASTGVPGGGAGTPVVAGTAPGPTRAFTLAFTGDTLMHRPLVDQARDYASGAGFDFAPMFARISPIVSSVDLAVCHLETPVAPPGENLSTFPYYGVPAEVVAGLAAAGYDRCSTASNHTFDRGTAGIDATIGALETNGLAQSGMASDPDGTPAHPVHGQRSRRRPPLLHLLVQRGARTRGRTLAVEPHRSGPDRR